MITTSVRRTVFLAVGSLGILTVATFAILFAITTKLQRDLNDRMAILLMDETIGETALNLAHQQMLMASRYVADPQPETEKRFRDLGVEFYRTLRQYLQRDLTLQERRLVERIKESHEQLEVNALDAFSYARAGQREMARERSDRVAQNVDVLQREITSFLLGRRPQRSALQEQFASAMRWVFLAALGSLALLLLANLAVARSLRARLITPLQGLQDAAGRVTPGGSPLHFKPTGVTEIHTLADSFRQMSTRLLSAQEQSAEAHRRFSNLVASIDAVVWEARASDYACSFVSAYAEVLLGYPVSDWIGNPEIWKRVIHPEDYDQVIIACRVAVESGAGHELEYRMVTEHGEVIWVRDLVTVARENDTSTSLRGVIFNITTQRAQREALKHSEERFRALIENASDTVTVLDAKGATMYSGPSLTAVLGYDPADRAGRSVLEIIHPEDVPHARELLQSALERRVDNVVVDVRARHADGSWRWLEVKARNLLDHPAVGGLVMNSSDITERKMAELALASSEEQLRQSQKMEAIGRLAAGVAHDFNNILTAIHGYVDIAMETPNIAPIRDDLAQIKVAADRAVDLTKQLLAFGRKQMLQPEVLNICAAVQDVERMLIRLIGEDVHVKVSCHAPDAHARVDRGQLHQLLMNLAVNARDAMPDGGKLSIVVATADTYVLLRVSDTGTGMEPDVAERIFEPFFTTKPVGKGTGLGLSTVYGIVKQSGGHIEVESEVGAGTAFTIWLPVADSTQPAAATRETSSVAPEATRETTILVAEDEAAVRSLVQRLLRKRGYHVIVAADGQEAIEYLEKHAAEIDVVIADMVMPNAGGAEVAAALAQLAPATPLVLMSGYSEEEVLDNARHINSNVVFLSKPYSGNQLLAAIDRVLERNET